jgi:N-methylhydantoinase B
VGIDAATFEILRHRLWAINEEAAAAIANISGSPVANEAYDFNVGLLDAAGDVVVIGAYVMPHAAALDSVVKHVIQHLSENPGIRPGDMFITNDPYVGAIHQPDVVLVAPIFWKGRLEMWAASVVHQTDVGGPTAGGTIGAESIYQEPIPLAPMRLVEEGVIRADLEREYLIRSRMPELNALDLRGQIAANRIAGERIVGLIERYGVTVLRNVIARLVDSTAAVFEERLRSLPDGTWRHVAFIEHDGSSDRVYEVSLEMIKSEASLTLDLRGSSPQAPSLINCSPGALRGYALTAILTTLAFDLPWVPAALWRSVQISTTPGTVVDPIWPAGVVMGNTTTAHGIRTAVTQCIGMMLDASDKEADRVMAACMGTVSHQLISGELSGGGRFGTMITDGMGGGMGARAFRDGVDTGGLVNAPAALIGNVETAEYNLPVRYRWRRQRADTGGAGRFRGGVGMEMAYELVGVEGRAHSMLVSSGCEQPTSSGLNGGHPGAPNAFRIVPRGATASCFDSELAEILDPDPKSANALERGDVVMNVYTGGGGMGDPIERDPQLVLADVAAGLVSVDEASSTYGVELVASGAGHQLDDDATAHRRLEERRRRLGGATPRPTDVQADDGERFTSSLRLRQGRIGCASCGELLTSIRENVKDALIREERDIVTQWPTAARYPGANRFVFRRFYCPGCGRQIDTEVNLAGHPNVHNVARVPR